MLTRLSQLNWPRILFTRSAAVLLGIAAVASIGESILIHIDLKTEALGYAENLAIGIVELVGVIGFISLLVCMAFFWLRCDVSAKLYRTMWFVILLLGFGYGSHIVYYFVVYLPAVLRRLRNPECDGFAAEPAQIEESRGRIGPFSRKLLIGWILLALPIFAALFIPKGMSHLIQLVAVGFFLCSALVVSEAVFHVIVSVYRSGMDRPTRSDQENSSRSSNRE